MGESKRYYWIKLKTGFFNEDAIDFLLSQKNGCEYVVLYQMLCLKSANTNGQLLSSIGEIIIPYNVEKIARDTKYFDVDTVTVALELYKRLGLIYTAENGALSIANYDDMVGSETDFAKKKREYRARKSKDNLLDNVKTMSDKSIEYRDKSIEYRDKSIEYRDKNIDTDKNKRETYVSILGYYTSNKNLYDAILGYIEMRKKQKEFTTRAFKLALNKLDTLSDDDATKIEIVNQSVMNGWKSFYQLKSNGYQRKELPTWYAQTTDENVHDVDDEELQRMQEALAKKMER